MAEDTRGRFRERIRSLIAIGPEGRHAPPVIRRAEVEAIGASLGMDADAACLEFLGTKGEVWEFAPGGSFTTHTVHSAEDGSYPRNWSALRNVVLVQLHGSSIPAAPDLTVGEAYEVLRGQRVPHLWNRARVLRGSGLFVRKGA